MILTGKCKEDFLKWYYYNNYHHQVFTETSDDIFINALIIEWLDSVGIYIGITYFKDSEFHWRIHYKDKYGTRNSRPEAIEQAIIKANEIYNERDII